ncbi:hypothetical protein BDZ97DRAFT_1912260 [Flammula alnicola]|nr:hypothetical protein BDZ97DRAFT_1912260 [Flammula alnicola]
MSGSSQLPGAQPHQLGRLVRRPTYCQRPGACGYPAKLTASIRGIGGRLQSNPTSATQSASTFGIVAKSRFPPAIQRQLQRIRPGHEALLLAGGTSNDENGTDDRQWNANVGAESAVAPIRPATSTRKGQLLSMTLKVLSYHDFLNDMYRHPDSAATTRGLRVAAREANAQGFGADLSALSQEYEDILGMTRLTTIRERPPMRPEHVSRIQRVREQQAAYERFRDSRASRQPSPSVEDASATPASLSPFSIESQRYPALSDITTQTLAPQPPSNVPRSRPRIPGLIPPASPHEDPTEIDGIVDRYRLYHEALRTDDMGSNVNIDWSDEDFISWLFPARDRYAVPASDIPNLNQRRTERQQNIEAIRQDMDALRQNIDTIRITRTTDTDVSPPERSTPRRGWARLDADGNEIPPSEEEELERSRTEYRLQALQQARRHTAVAAQTGHPELSAGGLYQEHNNQRTMYGSVLDATLTVQEGRRRRSFPVSTSPSSNSMPFYVNPLPMPLTSMTTVPEIRKEDIYMDIIVPNTHALQGDKNFLPSLALDKLMHCILFRRCSASAQPILWNDNGLGHPQERYI